MEEGVAELKARLEDERRRLDEEIRHYPTPIPRCDAQFNGLYEQRARVARDLNRLKAIAARDGFPADLARLLHEYRDRPAEAAD